MQGYVKLMESISVNPDTGCWESDYHCKGTTYPRFRLGGAKIIISRWVYEHFHGSVPVDKPCILHVCDNTRCVNPLHLFAGTQADNAKDKTAKGRQAQGESHARAISYGRVSSEIRKAVAV